MDQHEAGVVLGIVRDLTHQWFPGEVTFLPQVEMAFREWERGESGGLDLVASRVLASSGLGAIGHDDAFQLEALSTLSVIADVVATLGRSQEIHSHTRVDLERAVARSAARIGVPARVARVLAGAGVSLLCAHLGVVEKVATESELSGEAQFRLVVWRERERGDGEGRLPLEEVMPVERVREQFLEEKRRFELFVDEVEGSALFVKAGEKGQERQVEWGALTPRHRLFLGAILQAASRGNVVRLENLVEVLDPRNERCMTYREVQKLKSELSRALYGLLSRSRLYWLSRAGYEWRGSLSFCWIRPPSGESLLLSS